MRRIHSNEFTLAICGNQTDWTGHGAHARLEGMEADTRAADDRFKKYFPRSSSIAVVWPEVKSMLQQMLAR